MMGRVSEIAQNDREREKKYGILSTRRLSKRGDNNDINDGNHYVAIKLNKRRSKKKSGS